MSGFFLRSGLNQRGGWKDEIYKSIEEKGCFRTGDLSERKVWKKIEKIVFEVDGWLSLI